MGAKVPVLSPALCRAAAPTEISLVISRAFNEISCTRFTVSRVAMAAFIAGLVRYQAPAAQEETLLTLRVRGFALLANASEASLMQAKASPLEHRARGATRAA